MGGREVGGDPCLAVIVVVVIVMVVVVVVVMIVDIAVIKVIVAVVVAPRGGFLGEVKIEEIVVGGTEVIRGRIKIITGVIKIEMEIKIEKLTLTKLIKKMTKRRKIRY